MSQLSLPSMHPAMVSETQRVVHDQACKSWPTRADCAYREGSHKETGTKMERSDRKWKEVLQLWAGRKEKYAFFLTLITCHHILSDLENNRYKGSLRIILLKLPIFLLTACSLQMMHTTVSNIHFHYSCCYKEMLHEKKCAWCNFFKEPLKAAQGGVSTVAVAASPACSAASLLLFLLFLTASPLHHLPQQRRSDGELLLINISSPKTTTTEREGDTQRQRETGEEEGDRERDRKKGRVTSGSTETYGLCGEQLLTGGWNLFNQLIMHIWCVHLIFRHFSAPFFFSSPALTCFPSVAFYTCVWLVCAGWIAAVGPPWARTLTRTRIITRRGAALQKLLAKEEIELDKLSPREEVDKRSCALGFLSFLPPGWLIASPPGPNRSLYQKTPSPPPFTLPFFLSLSPLLPGNEPCLDRLWPSQTTGHLPASRRSVCARRAGVWGTASWGSRCGARIWRRGSPSTKSRWVML